MSYNIFINCIQHQLTEEQKKEALKLADYLYDIKEFEVFEDIKASASDEVTLNRQANRFIDFLLAFTHNYDKVYVHLPIGSPAFMFMVAQKLNHEKIIPIFSHTERIVLEEANGVKKTVFKFQNFIIFEF